MGLLMKFSENEPEQSGEPRELNFFDYVVIYLVADVASSGIITLLAGGGLPWSLLFAYCAWWLHVWRVKKDIESGRR